MDNEERQEYLKDFVKGTVDEIFDESEAANWTPNELFDVAVWIFNDIVAGLSDQKIVPLDELKRRVQEKMKENIDDVFQQLKNHEQEIISPPEDA